MGENAPADSSKDAASDGTDAAIVVRPMHPEDVDQCLAIFRDHELVDSSQGLYTCLALEPAACFVAVDEGTDEVIGMCTGNTLDPRVAVIGFYGVKVGHQGQGIGRKVWNRVMQYLGPDRNIGLFASPAEVDMYEKKAGFVVRDSQQMLLFETRSPTINLIAPSADESLKIQILPTTGLVDEIAAFENSVLGIDRSQLLHLSLKEPQTISFAAVDPQSRGVIGYGAMRGTNFTDGRAILSPLYASSYDVAKVILFNLLINCPNAMERGFFSFVLSSNTDASRLVEAAGLTSHFGAPRMFTKELISGIDDSRIFGILSPDVALC